MDAVVQRILGNVRLGEATSAGALTVLPIFGDLALGPEYITFPEAMAHATLEITEVDQGGVVGQLRAHNKGAAAVLIIDGEELKGAKQNRILNTSVLIGAGATVDLPVSCTEQGRWHYESPKFADSGNLLAHSVRAAARESVTANVRGREVFASDQGRVWDGVGRELTLHCASSPTHAMRDAVEHRRVDMDALVGSLEPAEGQRGVLALVGGRVAGFDLISRPEAFAVLHDRIVRSYALDATASRKKANAAADAKAAKQWLVSLADVIGSEHDSPGMGRSHRYTGLGVAGAALTHRSAIVHAAFLSAVADEPPLRRQRPRY